MQELSENEIRGSFVNCSKGEAKRLTLPREPGALPWEDLDFLGWRDPRSPERGHLVTEHEGRLVGVTLRVPSNGPTGAMKTSVCSICLTPHAASGVSLQVAPRVGAAGRQGNTVGVYMCADLACPLYVRGRKTPDLGSRYQESLTVEEQIARLRANLGAFLDKVLDGGGR